MPHFHQSVVEFSGADPFARLLACTRFEDVSRGKGRVGAVLVDVADDGSVPLVRTTTQYSAPAQQFQPAHTALRDAVEAATGITGLNNVLAEVYDERYRSMGFHSDQAQDLAPGSCIAVYSCYENPADVNPDNLRKLVVEDKETGETTTLVMKHGTVIHWDLATNAGARHKIVLPSPAQDNRWLGMTMRVSRTWIHNEAGTPTINGMRLRLGSQPELRRFYQLRSQENRAIDFEWPDLDFTCSPSDLLPVVGAESTLK